MCVPKTINFTHWQVEFSSFPVKACEAINFDCSSSFLFCPTYMPRINMSSAVLHFPTKPSVARNLLISIEIRFVGQHIFHLRFISKGPLNATELPSQFHVTWWSTVTTEFSENCRAGSASRCATVYYLRRDGGFFSLPHRVFYGRRPGLVQFLAFSRYSRAWKSCGNSFVNISVRNRPAFPQTGVSSLMDGGIHVFFVCSFRYRNKSFYR